MLQVEQTAQVEKI